MLLSTFIVNSKEQDNCRLEIEKTLVANISKLNEKKVVNHILLHKITSLCDEYLRAIPFNEGRKYFYSASSADKAVFLEKYPNAYAIHNIQKAAVQLSFLPEAASRAKSRWRLLQNLLNPQFAHAKGKIVAGKRLKETHWTEFRYQGDLESYRWICNIPAYHLDSHSEAMQEKETQGFGMHNILYASPKQQDKFFVTFNKENLLVDKQGIIINTTNARLLSRTPGMTVYVYTHKGLYLFPDENEKNYQALIRHSSLLAGHPVLCAGMMGVRNGKIMALTNESGHYQPTKRDFDKFIAYLKQKIDLSHVSIKCYDYKTHKMSMLNESMADSKSMPQLRHS